MWSLPFRSLAKLFYLLLNFLMTVIRPALLRLRSLFSNPSNETLREFSCRYALIRLQDIKILLTKIFFHYRANFKTYFVPTNNNINHVRTKLNLFLM